MESGFWKTICISLISSVVRDVTSPFTSMSRNCIFPPERGSSPMSPLTSDDLPQPDSPTRPRVRPLETRRLTSSTALTYFFSPKPNRLTTESAAVGYHTFRFCESSTRPSAAALAVVFSTTVSST